MTDDWLRAASTDDNLVADLLLRLQDPDLHPSRQAGAVLASLPPFHWGKRFPRSRNIKDPERTRRSPTTPLSWGAASPSHSCDCEDTSMPSDTSFTALRSKHQEHIANETTTSGAGVKRPRRKKTFAELKEQESSLIKDRTLLTKELDALRIKLEGQRSLNRKLKKTKLDLHPQLEMKKSEKIASMEKVCFVLPDLNMDPEEETIERR